MNYELYGWLKELLIRYKINFKEDDSRIYVWVNDGWKEVNTDGKTCLQILEELYFILDKK